MLAMVQTTVGLETFVIRLEQIVCQLCKGLKNMKYSKILNVARQRKEINRRKIIRNNRLLWNKRGGLMPVEKSFLMGGRSGSLERLNGGFGQKSFHQFI
jgi:hypothetical protein